MKKVLLATLLLILSSCADESGSNGSDISDRCPINVADFKFDFSSTPNTNGYTEVTTVLMSEDKSKYKDDIRWRIDNVVYDSSWAPVFTLSPAELQRPVIAELYYQGPSNKCGEVNVNDPENQLPKSY